MTIDSADTWASYLVPEIETAQAEQLVVQKAIQYKQAGLDFINACKLAASDSNNVIDATVLKAKLIAAIAFVQAYHDEIDEPEIEP